jgi:hypothetical protein
VGVFAGNFNGTGLPDLILITGSYDETRLLILRDAGAAGSEERILKGEPGKAVVADFNGDGLDDIVFAGTTTRDNSGNATYRGPSVLARRSTSSFHEPLYLAEDLAGASDLAAGDLNGDGKADLVLASLDSGTVSYVEAGDAVSWPGFNDWASSKGVIDPAGDPDGDGATNFQEYIAGREPGAYEAAGASQGRPGEPPVLRIDQPRPYQFMLHARHPRPVGTLAGAVEVVLEHSSDLREWTPVTGREQRVQSVERPGWEVIQWDFQIYRETEGQQDFYRFRAASTSG